MIAELKEQVTKMLLALYFLGSLSNSVDEEI